MSLDRLIGIYDNNSGNLLKEISVNHIPFDELNRIFKAYKHDELLIHRYTIQKKHIKALSEYISYDFDLKKETYILESFRN